MCTYNAISSHTDHFKIQKRDSEESLLTFVNLYPRNTLNIVSLKKNNNIFEVLLAYFLRVTLLKVIVLCRKIIKYSKILYRLLVYFTSFTVCSGDIKKQQKKTTLKMTSQLVIFRAFFLSPSTLNLIFFPRKSTTKKILA